MKRIMLLTTVILMEILAGAEVDLFVPSFPELQQIFNLSPFLVEGLLSFNFIGFCISLFFVGTLADLYGRKPIITFGLIVFAVGSILCLLAKSYHFLLIGRFLQGIGVAAPSALSFVIISDLYSIKNQQFYTNILNTIINLAVAVAPIVGSYVTIYFHWQGNFWGLLILGLAILMMTLIFIPKINSPRRKDSLELNSYFPIFKSKSLMLAIACIIFMYAHWWVFIGIAPILYMEGLGVSISQFGYYQGTLAFVFALGSFIAIFIIDKFDQRLLLNISYKICALSLIMIIIVTYFNTTNPIVITLSLIPFYVGTVIPFAIIYPLALSYMPEAKSKISAMTQILRLIFVALCLELSGYFYDGSFQNIGIVMIFITILSLITLKSVIKDKKFMKF